MKRAQELGGRKGAVFALRLTEEQRAELERMHEKSDGPRAFGPWLVWRALGTTAPAGITSAPGITRARRGAHGITRPGHLSLGITRSSVKPRVLPPPATSKRIVLDLCAGSGAWSEPYKEAGYRVVRVTLPKHDVRTFVPPRNVWGVLAAPPCDQFSLARNGHPKPRDVVGGLEVVSACLRIVHMCAPKWWALENPAGLLSTWLGPPSDTWEPCDFGDPWTKRTAIWGAFTKPARGPYAKPIGPGPLCTVCDPGKRRAPNCSNPAHRAVTPAGFARAFFEANP
jgi:hypothetical protein